jgi:CRISPR-associated protein Cmr1
MITFEFDACFDTPAFLGDADQNGRWRTPPFKALLRQWWRVVHARDHDPRDIASMREIEGKLFGSASGKTGNRSRVRVRLDGWQPGSLLKRQWTPLPGFRHEEVNGGREISADSYLGFGPVDGRSASLRNERAIGPSETRRLSLGLIPDGELRHDDKAVAAQLRDVLALINLYGTLGGRSRNGWGSLRLTPQEAADAFVPAVPFRPWRDLLCIDWPSAIGADDKGPLVWSTQPMNDWRAAMAELARVRYRVRRHFRLDGIVSPHAQPAPRHWLAYPVTNHKVTPWDRKGNPRLPNSLRLKVRAQGDRFVGVVFHMPVRPLDAVFQSDQSVLETVWSAVHRTLDDRSAGSPSAGLNRAPF